MANYTPGFIAKAKSFMNDLLLAGGVLKDDKNVSGRYINYIDQSCKNEAKIICDELLHKKFNFTAVDNALSTIANLSRLTTISLDKNRLFAADSAKTLAEYIAWFCKKVNNK
jgi:hypothetical protein